MDSLMNSGSLPTRAEVNMRHMRDLQIDVLTEREPDEDSIAGSCDHVHYHVKSDERNPVCSDQVR